MTYKQPGRRSILSRLIAGMILTGIYCFSLVGATALVVAGSSTEASARGRGGGGRGGGGRGRGWGRGRGRGGGCVFSPVYGRVVCY